MVASWTESIPEDLAWLEIPLRIVVTIAIGAIVLWLVRLTISRVVRRFERGRTVLRQRARRIIGRTRRDTPPDTDPLVAARRSLRADTLASVLRSAATLVMVIVVTTVILTILEIDLAPLIASAGIAGVALGFGAQSLIKDYFSGIAILIEDQYGIGDVIEVGDVSGTVEEVGLRVTQVRDFDGTLWYLRNGELLKVGNRTQGWSRAIVEVRVKPDEDIARVQEALREAADLVAKEPELGQLILGPAVVTGLEELTATSAMLRVLVKTAPARQWEVARALRAAVRERLAEAGIQMVV